MRNSSAGRFHNDGPLAAREACQWCTCLFSRSTRRRRLKTLSGTWLDKDLSFSYDPPSRSWYALGGIALKTSPGSYTLHLNGLTKAGHPIEFRRDIRVSRGNYKIVVALSVPKKFTEPDPEQVDQINHDKSLKDEAFKKTTPDQEWAGAFKPPVDASYSDVFGTQRKFNGAVLSIHQGLDYRVPAGTPVSAVNAGTVLLAQPLFFEGNCVVIDHGQGLLTLYLHLSKLSVKEGDRIERGQEIGISGATGRATGAHLHLAVRWRGEYFDPATLLTLRLPETTSENESAQAEKLTFPQHRKKTVAFPFARDYSHARLSCKKRRGKR